MTMHPRSKFPQLNPRVHGHNTDVPSKNIVKSLREIGKVESLERFPTLLENASLFRDGSPIQAPRRKWVDTGERGLLASQNLRKREKLLFVPPSLVIAADSVRTNGEAGEVMKRFDVPDLPLLATCASIDDDAAAVADEGARLAVHGRIDANATEFQELLDSLKAICSPISLRVRGAYSTTSSS
ncbi:hypothetical protein Bca52824_011238 [Brassica carinata]|uniref:Uncharacterized protein n=1 Tax=Brassica carinata TaxID=52824 RepID=A0A8X8BAX5_BRACI|nr:hypothetical protein Bca52824_011238 [Brassica carinata]